MTIVYRSEKGAPLTSNELDSNFQELDTRLRYLEDNPGEAEGIHKVGVEGETISFTGSFGTNFGTFHLPKTKLPLCGLWNMGTHYQTYDIITNEGGFYECLEDHLSSKWIQDQKLWKCILPFPKFKDSPLPLFEKATLPMDESPGKIVILLDEDGLSPIFFNGKTWHYLKKGDAI